MQGLQRDGGLSAAPGPTPPGQGASGGGVQQLQHRTARPQHHRHAGVCGGEQSRTFLNAIIESRMRPRALM